jgi:hypothetical protein
MTGSSTAGLSGYLPSSVLNKIMGVIFSTSRDKARATVMEGFPIRSIRRSNRRENVKTIVEAAGLTFKHVVHRPV